MISKNYFSLIILSFSFLCFANLSAQIVPGVYMSESGNKHHELKISDNYIIHSIYESDPDNFIKTVGGFLYHNWTESSK